MRKITFSLLCILSMVVCSTGQTYAQMQSALADDGPSAISLASQRAKLIDAKTGKRMPSKVATPSENNNYFNYATSFIERHEANAELKAASMQSPIASMDALISRRAALGNSEVNSITASGISMNSLGDTFSSSEQKRLCDYYNNQNRDVQADIIPTAGATETFTVVTGDNFFDPGGPGGANTDGTPGNYPNCGCITTSTLAGANDIEFLVFGINTSQSATPFDWIKIYDGATIGGTVLYDNTPTGANAADRTLPEMIASNGSAMFSSTTGNITIEFRSSTVVNWTGWDIEINPSTTPPPPVGCSQAHPITGSTMGSGVGSSLASNFKTASDITVAAGENFILDTANINFLTIAPNNPPTSATVKYYEDAAGFPGTMIGMETVVPTIISSAPWLNPVADRYVTSLALTPFTFTGDMAVSKKYWIEIAMAATNSPAQVFWEATLDTPVEGRPAVQFDSATGMWTVPIDANTGQPRNNQEVIYSYSGDCEPITGGSVPSVAYVLDVRNDPFGTFSVDGPYTIATLTTNVGAIFAGDFDGSGNLFALDNTNLTLLSIDTTTGAESTVGPVVNNTAGQSLAGLAWNQANSTMYALSVLAGAHTLYTVNLTTGEFTVVSTGTTAAGELLIWLAIDNDGNAYSADIVTDNLFSVNLTTAAATLVGPLGLNINFAQDADFDPATNTLYMGAYTGGGTNQWASVNTATGAATSLGTVNANNAELGLVAILGDITTPPPPNCTIVSDCNLTDTTPDDATSPNIWDRPVGAGPAISGAGPVSYDVYGPFTVDTAGNYTFDSTQNGWDGYLHLYQDCFDPLDQLTGLLAGDDDGPGGIGTSQILDAPLAVGTSYYLITSGFGAGDFGDFTNVITGAGMVTCGSIGGGDQWTVTVEDTVNFGDEVSWELRDNMGTVILSGGPYGTTPYSDTQMVTTENEPLEFFIESEGAFGDNTPMYTVSCSGNVIITGQLVGGTNGTFSGLVCGGPVLDNDTCANATTVACGDIVTGDTSDNTDQGGNNASPDEWFKFTGTGSPELVTISLCDGSTTYDSRLTVFDSCGGAIIATNDDFCAFQSQLTFASDGTSTYFIAVEGFGVTSVGSFTMEVTCAQPPANDLCANAIAVSCGDSVMGTTVNASIDDNESTNCGTSITAPGVWYTLADTSGLNSNITLSLCDGTTAFDSKISVFTGVCGSLVCVDGNDDACGATGLQSQISFASDGNTTFYILVHAFGGATGTFTMDVSCELIPPPNDMIVNSIDVDQIGFPYTDPNVAMSAATVENGNPAGCNLTGANGVWYNFVAEGSGTATASITTPAGTSAVTFYTAPNENAIETDLALVVQNSNQCLPGTQASINTVAGQAYYVFVLNTGGSTDIVIDGTNLGIGAISLTNFTFFPNPANSSVNLKAAQNIEWVKIYSMLGQEVVSQTVNNATSEINISGLSTGTYIMKVSINGELGTYKLLKQ